MKKAKVTTPQQCMALRVARRAQRARRRAWRLRLGSELSKIGEDGLDLAILGGLTGDNKSATVGKIAIALMWKTLAKRYTE